MADVITRFKLETSQYDSKLRDASKGLAEYTRKATLAGNEFGKFTQKNVEAARALGTITPSATNAKDKVKELVGAFNDAAKAYNALTKEQQQSDFGKALAESIGQLNVKVKEAKQELYGMGDAIKKAGSGGSLFAGLGDKMSGALQVFSGNMLTKAAGAVANLGSEMYGMVQQGIELAKQGEGIRIAFERLGRGDILDGLRQATHGTVTDLELMKAAVKFNDFKLPLDQMGTLLAFAQQKAKDTGQSVDYLVESIVNGLGRQSLMILDNLGLSASEIKDRMKETGDMTTAVADIIREQMAAAGDYVETAADRATQADVNLKNAMEELGRTLLPLQEEGASVFTGIETAAINALNSGVAPLIPKIIELKSGISELYTTVSENTVFRGMVNWMEAGIDASSRWIPLLNTLRGLMQGNAAGAGSSVGGAISKVISEKSASNSKVPLPVVPATTSVGGRRGGKSSISGGGGSRGGFDLSKIAFDPNKALLSATKSEDTGPSVIWKAITEGANESSNSVRDLTKAFEELNAVQGVTAGEGKKDSSAMSDSWRSAGTAISAVGSAMSQIEDPAAKVAATIAQAIATIALTYAQSLKGTFTPWDWIAAAVSGVATMASVISTIHSATGYAEGGIVGGNQYSGDNIYAGNAMVNSGELVLNKAQQGNLASQLQGNGINNMNISGRIKGTDIILSVDRSLQLQGKQLLTWG